MEVKKHNTLKKLRIANQRREIHALELSLNKMKTLLACYLIKLKNETNEVATKNKDLLKKDIFFLEKTLIFKRRQFKNLVTS